MKVKVIDYSTGEERLVHEARYVDEVIEHYVPDAQDDLEDDIATKLKAAGRYWLTETVLLKPAKES